MVEHLGVRVVGEFRLDGADLATLRSRKARTLLKALALARGAAVSADALADVVWSAELPADPPADLAVLVSRARSLVGADRIVRSDGGYALVADWCDSDELERLTREAARRHDTGDVAGARAAAEAALALVRGPLLADEPDAGWAVAPRRAAAALVGEACRIAASSALAAGHAGDAAAHARAGLTHDPYDEESLRLLMTAHALSGRPASALAVYAEVRRTLGDDLGVSPAPETEEVHRRILLGEPLDVPVAVPAQPQTVLVGRERELATLDAALARSMHAAEVVVVRGEPGAGKSALVDHWASRARAAGVVVLAGRAAERGLALQPVLDALAAQSSVDDGMEDPAAGPRLALPGPVATGAAMQGDVFAHLSHALARLTQPAGLALVIDDAHDADPVTRSWIGHLLRQREHHRLLVVAAMRDESDDPLPSTQGVTLGPLALDDVVTMFGRDRAAALYERTGGNALLLTELAGAGADDATPNTVRDAVAARLRRAGDAASTLRAAAVLGDTIDLDLVAAATGTATLDVLAHLDEGVRRSFLVERDGVLAFRHDLVRAAVAAEVSVTRRAWLHRNAARVLAGRQDVQPMDLARHAREGGDRVLAAAGLADAADIARSRLDLAGAEQLLDEAIRMFDSADARVRRSRVRMARADLAGADDDAEVALSLGADAVALELRAWAARNRHDMESAIRLGTAGAAAATSDEVRTSCLIAVALAHRGLGDLRRADDMLAEAAAGDPPPSLGLGAWQAVLRVHQGRPDDALALLEPLLGLDVSLGLQAYWVEHVLQMTAHAFGLVGRSSDALRMIDRLAVELDRRGTHVRYGGVTNSYRSWLLRNLGGAGAIELAAEGIEIGASQEIRAQCRLDLADSLLVAGRSDDAAGHLALARDEAGARWFHNRWRYEQRIGVLDARLQLDAGNAASALDAAERVGAEARGRGDRRYATIAELLAVIARCRLGRRTDPAALDTCLDELPRVAALESWWLAAAVAEASGSARAHRLAGASAAQLALDAGEHAADLRRAVAARLG